MKKILVLTLVVFVGIISIILIQKDKVSSSHSRLITTSFYPIYFLTNEIAGGNFDVLNITPSGAEPHDYEPTTSDLTSIEKSEFVFVNGSNFEPWVGKINSGQNPKVIELSQGIANLDPHIWLDPILTKQIALKIEGILTKADPQNTSLYQQRSIALQKKLDDLDTIYKSSLTKCKLRSIITSHDAFGYLAKRYHFTQIAIAGLSPDEEPSPAKLAEVATLAKEQGIKYIFFETLVSPRLAQTLAQEIDAQTLVFNPIEGLSKEEEQEGADYFSIQRSNLENIKKALQCQ